MIIVRVKGAGAGAIKGKAASAKGTLACKAGIGKAGAGKAGAVKMVAKVVASPTTVKAAAFTGKTALNAMATGIGMGFGLGFGALAFCTFLGSVSVAAAAVHIAQQQRNQDAAKGVMDAHRGSDGVFRT
jgi:hypothetical protein